MMEDCREPLFFEMDEYSLDDEFKQTFFEWLRMDWLDV